MLVYLHKAYMFLYYMIQIKVFSSLFIIILLILGEKVPWKESEREIFNSTEYS